MRLLDRYLLRELLIPLGYCLGGFLIFWIAFDLYTELSNFQRHHLHVPDVAEYYVWRTPDLLGLVLPVAFLLALLYALTNHARHHELTAIRAAGVSLWRLSLPYLGLGVAFSLGLFLLNEWVAPDGAERAEQILQRRDTTTDAALAQWQRDVVFENERAHRTWRIGFFHPRAGQVRQVQIDWTNPDGSHRQIHAQRGEWQNGAWLFTGVQEFLLPAGSAVAPPATKHDSLALPDLNETPDLIRSEIKISALSNFRVACRTQLSLTEIAEYLRLHPKVEPQRRDLLLTKFHSRLAAPLTCLVVVLIALPFGAASGRRNAFVGVASSVFICFGYFVAREVCLALGSGGHLVPWLASWAPNAVFAITGFVLTERVR